MPFDIFAAIKAVAALINKVVPDKAAAAAAIANLQEMQLQGQLEDEFVQLKAVTSDQSEVDKAEATNTSVFVAGWRPMIGWVCAVALATQYIVKPLVLWGHALFHYPVPILPGIDDILWQLMFGMLGLGAQRSYEKIKGVATTSVGKK